MADFDDFDDFDFKPVTKGLGFHHQEKKEVKNYKRSTSLENATHRDAHRHAPVPGQTQNISRNDLSSFYNDPTPKAVELPSSLQRGDLPSAEFKSAPMSLRFFAGVIDELVIMGLTCATVIGFILLLGARWEAVLGRMPWYEVGPFAFVIYALYFVAYFTILDPQATVGKNILHLKLVSRSKADKVEFASSFLRAVVCLLSPLLLFVPILLDWSGKISSTYVAKR